VNTPIALDDNTDQPSGGRQERVWRREFRST
jgi:hypothetical protein